MNRICEQRLKLWNCYHTLLQPLEEEGFLFKRPFIPKGCGHNGYIYYIVLPSEECRDRIMNHLKQMELMEFFIMYLHSSPAGMKFGKVIEHLPVTEEYSKRLLRLPLWVELEESVISKIVNQIQRGLEGLS